MFINNVQYGDKSRKKYRIKNSADFSPTLYQLEKFMQAAGFKRTRWGWRAKFTERNLDFAQDACECLEFKHLLALLLAKHCPQVMPETYVLNDYSWSTVLSDIAQEHYLVNNQFTDEIKDLAWILKPSLLNNGQHIKIFTRLSQIEEHMLYPNRLGGPHVLQRYINHPDLYDGRKYSLRFFVVITRESGAFLYQHGYLNVALAKYTENNFEDLAAHLTNEHLHDNATSVVQIPTIGHAKYAIWYDKIKTIIKAVSEGLRVEFPNAFLPQKNRTFAVFGFDFMCDDHDNMWLLEVNHGPCFPIESHHPLQETLYQQFWQAVVTQFVLPITTPHPIAPRGVLGFDALNEQSR